MGRNRRKGKATVTKPPDTSNNTSSIDSAKPKYSNRDESKHVRKEMAIDYKKEATRAWKAYVTLATNYSLCKLARDIDSELNKLDTPEYTEIPPPYRLSSVAKYQQDVRNRILELIVAKEAIKQQFQKNLRMLEAGEPFCNLPLIDPALTLDAVEDSVYKECSIELNISQTCYESRQSSVSRGSPDSAMHDMDGATGLGQEASDVTILVHSEPYDEEWTIENEREDYGGPLPLAVSSTLSNEQTEKVLKMLKPIPNPMCNGATSDPTRVVYYNSPDKVYSGSSQNISVEPISVSSAPQAKDSWSQPWVEDSWGQRWVEEEARDKSASWSKIAATTEGEEWKMAKKRTRTVSQNEEKVIPQEPAGGYCLDYLNTKICKFGDNCKFKHYYDPKLTVRKPPQTTHIVPVKTDVPASKPQDNALFQGEEGQMRRKTAMCRSYKRGECHWGAHCNYAHSEEELQAALTKLENSKSVGSKVSVVKPAGVVKAEPSSVQGKLLMCKGHQLGHCKRSAQDCNYAHHPNELDPAFDHKEPCRKQQCPGRLRYERRKTAICKDYQVKGKCLFGEDCHYAHSRKELRQLPKHEMCSRFGGGASCVPDSECVYAHHKKDLRPPSPVNGTTASAAAGTTTSLSATSETAKTKGLDHFEPCTKQHCPGRLAYETRCTKLCPSMRTQTECKTTNCNKAHSRSELRPLPKYEMCSKYGGTKKCLPADECPYAHTKTELRVVSGKSAAPVIRGSAKEASGTKSELASKTPVKPAATAAVRPDKAAMSVDDECLICFSKVVDKVTLACGHDRFHYFCISKWLNEGRPHCPCCNHPASIPDVFQAPAGMEPSDFPSLGLH